MERKEREEMERREIEMRRKGGEGRETLEHRLGRAPVDSFITGYGVAFFSAKVKEYYIILSALEVTLYPLLYKDIQVRQKWVSYI